MRCLTIQIQPEFVADFDKADFLARVRLIGRSPEVDKFTEQGLSYLSFNFFTEMPVLLWRDLYQNLYMAGDYGTRLAAISIAVCDGEKETDDYLILHHPDPTEKRDLLV